MALGRAPSRGCDLLVYCWARRERLCGFRVGAFGCGAKVRDQGEALNQLSKADPALASRIADLHQVIAFRNVLIHGYVAVKHDRVWGVVSHSLPTLRQQLDDLLNELGPPGP